LQFLIADFPFAANPPRAASSIVNGSFYGFQINFVELFFGSGFGDLKKLVTAV
jgi:hypothetical protein